MSKRTPSKRLNWHKAQKAAVWTASYGTYGLTTGLWIQNPPSLPNSFLLMRNDSNSHDTQIGNYPDLATAKHVAKVVYFGK